MPNWVEKILKYSPGEKSLKDPFTIYLDLEGLIKKEQSNQNNNNNYYYYYYYYYLEKSYAEKKTKDELSGWAMFI